MLGCVSLMRKRPRFPTVETATDHYLFSLTETVSSVLNQKYVLAILGAEAFCKHSSGKLAARQPEGGSVASVFYSGPPGLCIDRHTDTLSLFP